MIEVFDTAAAGIALARRKLGCPDCAGPLRPWGHARERTVRDRAGAMMTVCPDRARCPGCQVTHVVLDAALLPRRAYSAALVGQALVASARGSGHRRIALDLDVPAGTVRGWIRGARRSAVELRVTGIRAAVAYDQDALPAPSGTGELRFALECLAAAAVATGRRLGVEHVSPWAMISILTRGRLLDMAPAG
jgi:Domain of unknown function (DUF6431)